MKLRTICIDTEYDARYVDSGVARLSCMTYSFGPEHAEIVGPREAVELFRGWAEDPSVVFLGHSVYNDLAVLAHELYFQVEGEHCAPGEGWAWELAHRLYDPVFHRRFPRDVFRARTRVIDTEIRQRLTYIRYGPDKASAALGAVLKLIEGTDMSDSKAIPDDAKELLASSVPYEDWPQDVFVRTPWRVLFGYLLERYGPDVRAWPQEAVDYALEDARAPWRVLEWQRKRWGRERIPDDTRQTMTSWALHVLAIPGWKADSARAQGIHDLYQSVVDACDETLIDAGVLYVPGTVETAKRLKLQAAVIEAFGDEAPPLSKTAKKRVAAGEELTAAERQAATATDDKTVKKAIDKASGELIELEAALAAHRDRGLLPLLEASRVPTLNVHRLRRQALAAAKKLAPESPEILPPSRYDELVSLAVALRPVLVDAGLVELSEPRTLKKRGIADLVHDILGEDAPLTDAGAEQFPNPTPTQRREFCRTDSKTVREAITSTGGKLRLPADAVATAELGPEQFAAWLDESKQPVLNAYAVRSKAQKIQSSFLDYLRDPREPRVRTTYQTIVNTGRTSSRKVNIQQLPRDYDKPKHLHIRGCIVPDPGWAFLVADYTQLELCALAHVLNMLVRSYARDPKRRAFAEDMLKRDISEDYESTLAQAINNDQDCHVRMASVLRGRGETYEQCYALYERADAKKEAGEGLTVCEKQVIEDRQLAKPCNFGFPGGLGWRKFIDYAAGYGVTIDASTAKRAQAAYKAAWVEMKLYFWHIGQATKDGVAEVIKQLYSKRERGWCFFTQASNSYFQGLAADGAKEALRRIIFAAYRNPESPLYGTHPSGFVHDEFLVNARREQAEDALPVLEHEMIEGMRVWIPDVKIKAPGKVLYERWSK